MSSTRLPGKAMLPVAGYPSAILAALRAGNAGDQVVLATSDERADDVLEKEARLRGIAVFRGPLDDVLERYFLATASLAEDCVVIRLTADNVVPDGAFVEELARAFVSGGVEYLGMDSSSRAPHGLSGEAFSVAALRKAHAAASSAYDRQHVGPWMRRNLRAGIFRPVLPTPEDLSYLRCTIDDREDYERVQRLFGGVAEPVRVEWQVLTRKLAVMGESGSIGRGFTLGTAQLGMEYGVVNQAGRPLQQDAVAMVQRAIDRGVKTFDTARAYGDAEAILGEAMDGSRRGGTSVITKLDVSGLGMGASEAEARCRVVASIDASCKALRTVKLDTLLLHRWEHRYWWRGAGWQRLLELKEEGRIGTLGASVYEPAEALDALGDSSVEHLQIPSNVLDWRWKAAGVDQAIQERGEITVHARSVFLQGILLHSPSCWPLVDGFDGTETFRRLQNLAKEFGRAGMADLCLAYVRSQPWITSVVAGCETRCQLDDNLDLCLRPKLSSQQCAELESAIPNAPDALLNPSKWRTARARSAAYAS
jgi:spore coat polysaccharide biosynthesis protein SpsF